MKKILIISATRKTNYTLAKKLEEILLILDTEVTVISLEDYELPLYTDDIYKNKKDEYFDVVETLTKQFSDHKGLIICGPEYNGSAPHVITSFTHMATRSIPIPCMTDGLPVAFNSATWILVPTPSAPETNTGFSYPTGILVIPLKPPNPPKTSGLWVDLTLSDILPTKASPASISTPAVL